MARPVSKLTNYKWPDFPENPPEMVRATYAGVFVEMARGLQQLVEGMCISRFMVMSVIMTNTAVKQGTSQSQISEITKMDRRTIGRHLDHLIEQKLVLQLQTEAGWPSYVINAKHPYQKSMPYAYEMTTQLFRKALSVHDMHTA